MNEYLEHIYRSMVLKLDTSESKSEIRESLKFGAAEGWKTVLQIV
jgi:hypothetical protein